MSGPTKFYLFKRNNGIYYIGFSENGQRKWRSSGWCTRPEALKALTDFKRVFKPRTKRQALSEFASDYQHHVEPTLSPGTVSGYKASLRLFLSLVGDIPLGSITRQHVDMYKVERLKAIKPVTVNIELRALRAAFNVALRWDLIETNPFARLQQLRVPETKPTFLSKSDFEKLLSAIDEEWLKQIMVLSVLTGLRRGEMLNLRWRQVDLDRKLIHIESTETFTTKHGRTRMVPLGNTAHNLLKSKARSSTNEYVFTRRGRRISASWLSHRFKYYVRLAKLENGRLHFHSLRHTFASWLVQDGASLYEVQKLLGHSSIAVTQVYSHLQPEQLHETVNRLRVELN